MCVYKKESKGKGVNIKPLLEPCSGDGLAV